MLCYLEGQGFDLEVLRALTPEAVRRYFLRDGKWIIFCQKLKAWQQANEDQAPEVVEPLIADASEEEINSAKIVSTIPKNTFLKILHRKFFPHFA